MGNGSRLALLTSRVHILSDGFASPNGLGLVFPLLVEQRLLAREGILVKVFSDENAPGLGDCDLLVVDSKQFSGPVRGELAYVLDALARLTRGPRATAWYDTTDSAGWLAGDVLAAVPRYWKSQLLVDRSQYLKPLYGRRLYSDYYHRLMGVRDNVVEATPQVRDPQALEKLRLGWCSGLADYGRWAPARQLLWKPFRDPRVVPYALRFAAPSPARPRGLTGRIGTSYSRASVAWQRRELAKRLAGRLATGKVGRGEYFAELCTSRAVLSPFGLGEVCYRDFETFLAGAALVKPDMSHMQTWPDLYRPGETMVSFRWDLSDLEAVLQKLDDDRGATEAIARAGQRTYRHYLTMPEGRAAFREHFSSLVRDALTGKAEIRSVAGA